MEKKQLKIMMKTENSDESTLRRLLFFVASVKYEHVSSNLNKRRVCLLSSFGGDSFGGFRLERAPEDFDFHLLVLLQLLVNLTHRLGSEAIFANVDGWLFLFQHVLNVEFHSRLYFFQT